MAVNKVFLALMPISHLTAWFLILKYKKHAEVEHDPTNLYLAVAAISLFYYSWALYKVIFQGDTKEKGQISMGLLAYTALFQRETHPYAVLGAIGLVILNFAVVIPFFVNRGVKGIVKVLHKEVTSLTLAWGYVFLFYLLGNIGLWVFVLITLIPYSQIE